MANPGLTLKKSIIQKRIELVKEKRLPEIRLCGSQYNKILGQVADKVAEFSISENESVEEFENHLVDAFGVVDSAKRALRRLGEDYDAWDKKKKEQKIEKEDHVIWYHGDVEEAFRKGYESELAKEVDRDLMTDTTIEYLARPWMENELLEWIMVDSLIFHEIIEFGERIKATVLTINPISYLDAKGNLEKMQKKKRKGILRSLLGTQKEYKGTMKVNMDLLASMQADYKLLKAGTLSPKYFRDKLFETSKKGAVWPSAAIIIIEHATKRNPAIWNAPLDLTY